MTEENNVKTISGKILINELLERFLKNRNIDGEKWEKLGYEFDVHVVRDTKKYCGIEHQHFVLDGEDLLPLKQGETK